VKDARRYYAAGITVIDSAPTARPIIAQAASKTLAKRIANALNVYRPKVRRPKASAEKEVNPRPVSR
jgi:hypothetical protein